MQTKPLKLLKGALTFLPLVNALSCRGSGGSTSARYCYSMWFRHLLRAREAGFRQFTSLAELGPGDSLGVGLAALLSGAKTYHALDAKEHAGKAANLSLFDELVALIRDKSPLPGDDEFPLAYPRLENYRFPEEIFSELTEDLLSFTYLKALQEAIQLLGAKAESPRITYVAPWNKADLVPLGSLDLVVSQAVLEHVDDVEEIYGILYKWLKPGGMMSHTIDYKSHGYTKDWNGHWTLGDMTWKVLRGRRPYFINRLPHSAHIAAIERAGFRIITEERRENGALDRSRLAPRFRSLTDQDLRTAGAFIQAVKF